MKLREMMANKIYYSKVNDPNKWEGFPLAFECKNDEEAMKAEKLFNSLIQQLKEAREIVELSMKLTSSDTSTRISLLLYKKEAQQWLKKYGGNG